MSASNVLFTGAFIVTVVMFVVGALRGNVFLVAIAFLATLALFFLRRLFFDSK